MTQVFVAIVTRRLREGKSYEDFRRAWHHNVGFGVRNRMLTALNAVDPREVIVIGLTDVDPERAAELVAIDAAEREHSPLDEVVEPEIGRTFGVLIAEDDFYAEGEIDYAPACVDGVASDVPAIVAELQRLAPFVARLQQGSRQ